MQGAVSRRPQLLQFGQAKRGVYVFLTITEASAFVEFAQGHTIELCVKCAQLCALMRKV